jgi:cobyrinic acid a,c-diamide synthase
LSGQPLPACDAVWLPGGYPELHAARLAEQKSLWAALAAHVAAGKPLLAECGGMMCLFASLVDATGGRHAMAGLLPGEVRMQTRLAALGTEFVDLPEGRIAGHTFHYSRAQTPMLPATHARRPDDSPGEAVYRHGALLASYLHLYFPSAPQAVARLFGAAA